MSTLALTSSVLVLALLGGASVWNEHRRRSRIADLFGCVFFAGVFVLACYWWASGS